MRSATEKETEKVADLFSPSNRRYLRYGQRSGGASHAQEGEDRGTRCVVQRGHNRQVVFAIDDDCQFYLEKLAQLKRESDVRGTRPHVDSK